MHSIFCKTASRSSSSYLSHLPRYLNAGMVSMVVPFTVKVVARIAGWSCSNCRYSLRSVPRLQRLVRLWLAMLRECSRHFGHLGRYPSSRHVEGMVGSGINVIYSSLLVLLAAKFGSR